MKVSDPDDQSIPSEHTIRGCHLGSLSIELAINSKQIYNFKKFAWIINEIRIEDRGGLEVLG